MNITQVADIHARAQRKKIVENTFWYIVLLLVAVVTVFPFIWIFFTSFKGPLDAIYSVPPQLIPHNPTFANYLRVWDNLPVANFFINSVVVSVVTVVFNILITSLAAYPFAKMKFRGRDAIFYLLLATFVVPAQLTYIPSFVLAINVFHHCDSRSSRNDTRLTPSYKDQGSRGGASLPLGR